MRPDDFCALMNMLAVIEFSHLSGNGKPSLTSTPQGEAEPDVPDGIETAHAVSRMRPLSTNLNINITPTLVRVLNDDRTRVFFSPFDTQLDTQ